MAKAQKKNKDFEPVRVPVLKEKKAKLDKLAEAEGLELAPFLRPFLNRIADGLITL